jgi:hypothetical protein
MKRTVVVLLSAYAAAFYIPDLSEQEVEAYAF